MSVSQAFQAWLVSLGPLAYLLCAAVPVVGYLLYQRFKPVAANSTIPSPTPNAATMPPLLAGVAGLLHNLLVAAKRIPAVGATIDDISHGDLVQLGKDVAAVIDAHDRLHSTALVDLQRTSPTAPVTPPATPVA